MSVRGWVLVQTEAGHARAVCDAMVAYKADGVRVIAADTVTGPHDIIAHIEAPDVEALTAAAEDSVSKSRGVEHIVTCVAME